ncbi:MAG TPA: hypothetical protein DCM28_20905 [Phycisphaerales bacterium]|nr:hypothetical protein [Phycisphaerales bacterium]HCD31084.1 hypothetical protein [Phycisphaerales bacterium]
MNDTEQLPVSYTPDEAARILRVSRNTVDALRARGELGYWRVGRRVFITIEQLKAFIKNQSEGTCSNDTSDSLNTRIIGSARDRAVTNSTSRSMTADDVISVARHRARQILKKPSKF